MKKRIFQVAAVFLAVILIDCKAGEEVPKYGLGIKAEAKEIKTENLVELEKDLEEEEYWDSLELLALVVEAEAGNQSELGKRLVVDVVLNRVDSEEFPDTIWEVLTQKNAFSSYWDGGVDKVWEPADTTYRAIEAELKHRTNSEVLYFTANDFGSYGQPWKKVGDHYFCK